MISKSIRTKLRMKNGYLLINITTKGGRKVTKKVCKARGPDLNLLFWGDTPVRSTQDTIGLSRRERVLLAEGNTLRKEILRSLINRWVEERKQARLIREKSIRNIRKALRKLDKLSIKEEKELASHSRKIKSDIIPSMDGSTRLWLQVILTSKDDFLKGHSNPRRIKEWELLKPQDLEDESGLVIRGNEDAYLYLTARDFLFDDNYLIDFANPVEERPKSINCADLLDTLIENCKNRKIDSSCIDPSIKHLRSELARESGDPKLIELYCPKS